MADIAKTATVLSLASALVAGLFVQGLIGAQAAPASTSLLLDFGATPSISDDGRFVAFYVSDDEVPGVVDDNGISDCYLYDRQLDSFQRVSEAYDGSQLTDPLATGGCQKPIVSGDGNYVLFGTFSDSVVPGDANGLMDAFLFDRQAGTNERVSIADDESEANATVQPAGLSYDGNVILLTSAADDLVSGDTNNETDTFVRDRLSGTTERVSVLTGGGQSPGPGNSSGQYITPDGRYVGFHSFNKNFDPDDENDRNDVFVHDRQTVTTTWVNKASDGTPGDFGSNRIAISDDGRYAAFTSQASNLIPGIDGVGVDTYRKDLQTGVVEYVSASLDGTPNNAPASGVILVSSDGNLISFDSSATNLVPGDNNGDADIFLKEMDSGEIERINLRDDGTQSDSGAGIGDMSPEARFHVFAYSDDDLVPGVIGSKIRVYLRDRGTGVEASDFTVLAKESLHLGQGSSVLTGDIGANTATSDTIDSGSEVTLGTSVTMQEAGSRVMGDTVTLKNNSSAYDVHYNGLTNNGTVIGNLVTPLTLPLLDLFPQAPTVPEAVIVPDDGTLSLPAGEYAQLRIGKRATVTFTGGVYQFASADIDRDAVLEFDAVSDIRILGKLWTGNAITVGPASGSGIDASDIVVYVYDVNGTTGTLGASPKAADIGQNTVIDANLYAVNGTLKIGSGSDIIGALLGRWVDVGTGVALSLDSAF